MQFHVGNWGRVHVILYVYLEQLTGACTRDNESKSIIKYGKCTRRNSDITKIRWERNVALMESSISLSFLAANFGGIQAFQSVF